MIRALGPPPLVITELEPTPEERDRAQFESERFRANARRYEELAREIGERHVGKFICVAGGELFVGDDPVEVHARARNAHPDEARAFFSKFVSPHRGPKIYANRRRVGARG